jgi:hypothetical protein
MAVPIRVFLGLMVAGSTLFGCRSAGDHILDTVQGDGEVPAASLSPGDELRAGRTETLTRSGRYSIPAGSHELDLNGYGVIGYTIRGVGLDGSGSLSDGRQQLSVTGPGSLDLTIIQGAWAKATLDD